MIFQIKRRRTRAVIDFDAFRDFVYLTKDATNRIWKLYGAYIDEKGLKSPPNSMGRCSGFFEVLRADADDIAGKIKSILDDPNSWVTIDDGLLRRVRDRWEKMNDR